MPKATCSKQETFDRLSSVMLTNSVAPWRLEVAACVVIFLIRLLALALALKGEGCQNKKV